MGTEQVPVDDIRILGEKLDDFAGTLSPMEQAILSRIIRQGAGALEQDVEGYIIINFQPTPVSYEGPDSFSYQSFLPTLIH